MKVTIHNKKKKIKEDFGIGAAVVGVILLGVAVGAFLKKFFGASSKKMEKSLNTIDQSIASLEEDGTVPERPDKQTPAKPAKPAKPGKPVDGTADVPPTDGAADVPPTDGAADVPPTDGAAGGSQEIDNDAFQAAVEGVKNNKQQFLNSLKESEQNSKEIQKAVEQGERPSKLLGEKVSALRTSLQALLKFENSNLTEEQKNALSEIREADKELQTDFSNLDAKILLASRTLGDGLYKTLEKERALPDSLIDKNNWIKLVQLLAPED